KNKVVEKGRVTVVLNGVTLINDGQFDTATGGEVEDKLGTPASPLLQAQGPKVDIQELQLKTLDKETLAQRPAVQPPPDGPGPCGVGGCARSDPTPPAPPRRAPAPPGGARH